MKSLVQKFSYFLVFLLISCTNTQERKVNNSFEIPVRAFLITIWIALIMASCGEPLIDTTGTFVVIENPAVSPDGKWITFASLVFGDTFNFVPHSQYIVSIDGTEENLLFRKRSEAGTSSCWSPDGRQIVTSHGIYTIENKMVTDFRAKSSDMHLYNISDWSPDGKALLSYFGTKVFLCDTLFENIRELPFRAFHPRWMPDGNHIIGEMWSTGWAGTEIGITDTLCSYMVRLTNRNINETYYNPVPSPDGKMITFYKFNGVYVMNSDGTNQQFLCAGRYPAWTPDSKHIVYEQSGVWKTTLDGKEKIQITDISKY